MTLILDLDKLRNASIHSEYFPYCQVDCFIKQEVLWDVLHDFPKINVRGSIPAHRLTYGLYFQKLLDELYQNELRALISEKFSIDLSNSYPMLTVRGKTSLRDGHIHTDTPSKLITLLLYFNETWSQTTGNLRLLRDNSSLDNYFEEIIPAAGTLLIFKVTDNCWHGHYPFVGKRKAIQFNYVNHPKIVTKELRKHSYSYSLKKITHFLNLD